MSFTTQYAFITDHTIHLKRLQPRALFSSPGPPLGPSCVLVVNNRNKKRKRDFTSFDKDGFLEDLQQVDWMLNNNFDVNTCCSNFLLKFGSIVDKHVPLKIVSKQQYQLHHKPWITKGILKSIKHKQHLFYRYFIKGTTNQKQYYKKYSNKLNHLKE